MKQVGFMKGLFMMIGGGILIMMIGTILIPVFGIGFLFMMAGAIAILASPFGKYIIYESVCPYCNNKVVFVKLKKNFKCKACKQRVVISNDELLRVGGSR